MQGNPQNGELRAEIAIRVANIMRAAYDEANKLRNAHVVLRKLFVLNAAQMVKFLARLANHHLWIHQLGLCHILRKPVGKEEKQTNCLFHNYPLRSEMHAMEIFYSQWIIEERRLLNDLSSVPQNSPYLHMSTLISRALSHYAEYYDRLSQLAEQNIFLVFSAYWLNPVERSFFWLGGLKPSILFHLIPSDINDDQRREIEELKQQTVQRETELETIMYKVGATITVLMVTETMQGNPKNGDVRAELAIRVVDMMRAVFDEANKLRKYVMLRNLIVLNAAQMVKFLARVANHHLWIHQLGLYHMYSMGLA
ncbi:protein ZW2-like [Carex rostrata]